MSFSIFWAFTRKKKNVVGSKPRVPPHPLVPFFSSKQRNDDERARKGKRNYRRCRGPNSPPRFYWRYNAGSQRASSAGKLVTIIINEVLHISALRLEAVHPRQFAANHAFKNRVKLVARKRSRSFIWVTNVHRAARSGTRIVMAADLHLGA